MPMPPPCAFLPQSSDRALERARLWFGLLAAALTVGCLAVLPVLGS